MYAEDLSRRDLMKVAQYEVLGNDAKRQIRPVRDDRNVRLSVSNAAQRVPALVDRPVPPSSASRSKSEGGVLTTADRPGRIALKKC